LLETINGFFEMKNMIREARIDIAKRLLQIDIFIESDIDEDIFGIELMNWPLMGDNKRNKNNNSLHNRIEGIRVVKTRYLRITLYDKTCLESVNVAIKMIFGSEYPFRAHNIGVGRMRDQDPSLIILQSSYFSFMIVSQTRFLAANLYPLCSVEANRVVIRLEKHKAV
jgi:hypothetical protein